MTVLDVSEVEECANSKDTHEILVDGDIDRGLIEHLSGLGTLRYFADFEKPFFKVVGAGFALSGVVGNDTMRLRLDDPARLPDVLQRIAAYP